MVIVFVLRPGTSPSLTLLTLLGSLMVIPLVIVVVVVIVDVLNGECLGHLKYPFDVNKIIVWLSQRVDLVFVFFDPQGQVISMRLLVGMSSLS